MWSWNRPKRNITAVNYAESSEDEYESPVVSPARPQNTRAASPVLLAVPTLNDNVDEELEQVKDILKNIGHTHTFRGTKPTGATEVVVGHVAGQEDCEVADEHQPAIMVNYDQQNEDDDQGAIQNARDVKIPFNKNDIKLWFSLIESKMQFAGLKKQWSKKQVLIQLIPAEFHSDFKSFL